MMKGNQLQIAMSHINSNEKSLEYDRLFKIVNILSKEVKQEEDNLYRVLLGGLSAFTAEPLNMRILAPASEGKTYLLEKVSHLFPTENVMKLSSASPTSFKYSLGTTMVEEKGELIPLSSKMQSFVNGLDEEDKEYKKKIAEERKKLEKNAWTMIDWEDKWLIFLDSQNAALWEFFKSVLSNDTELIKHQVTNKQSGSHKQQRIVIRGKPSVTYASAKDEARRDVTSEIDTRFQTISLQANAKKYKESINLIGKHFGLVGPLYEKEVISKEEIVEARSKISAIIQTLKQYRGITRPILNPFSEEMSKVFPTETGSRQRQFQRMMRTSNLLTLCNADNRCKLEMNGVKYPITNLKDVSQAAKLIIENSGIPGHKIQTFNEVIKPSIDEFGVELRVEDNNLSVQTASEILEQYKERRENSYSRKQLLETYLIPLSQHGFLGRTQDPRNKTRDVFWIPERFQDEDATVESTLFDTSTLDDSCVTSFVKEHIISRLKNKEYQFYNTNDEKISVEEIPKEVTKIDID